MNIVVLDGHTLNPGDLNWAGLQALGDCRIYDRTSAAELPARAADADALITNKTPLNRETIEQLPKLKYIGVTATGFNVVEVAAAKARGIPVTNVPAYGTRSVAQTVFALLLELTQRAGHHSRTVHDGRWVVSPDWCYWDFPLVELDGLTLGIVGYGRIGQAVGRLAEAFGMKVLVTTRTGAVPPGANVGVVDLPTLLRTADVVSLHCPLTPETKGLINAERLALMKPSAFLLNTSRGPLIDDAALARALNSGQIAGAALDVLSVEPPLVDNPLLAAKNCVITPHIAWATKAARARLLDMTVANLRAFIAGAPQNVVNR